MSKFIVQQNLLNEDSLLKIKASLEKHLIPHEFISIIPFSREIISDSPLEGIDYLPYGSTSFTMETHRLGWKGQYFNPDTFNTDVWNTNRDDMLNIDKSISVIETIKFLRLQDPKSLWFIRPNGDLKIFTGQVIEAKECYEWLEDAMKCASSGSYQMEADNLVTLSQPRNIEAEWRWFIVDRKLVSGSLYRNNGRLVKHRVYDKDITSEMQLLADKWLPADCCVMDVAQVDGEFKIIEFNTINASGFYDHDIELVFLKLWKYFKK